jgi:hypothetical protein
MEGTIRCKAVPLDPRQPTVAVTCIHLEAGTVAFVRVRFVSRKTQVVKFVPNAIALKHSRLTISVANSSPTSCVWDLLCSPIPAWPATRTEVALPSVSQIAGRVTRLYGRNCGFGDQNMR